MLIDRRLIDEQREIDEGVPNTGRDRLLMRLQEVHVYPRYDFPPELSRHIDIHGFIRSMIKR